MEFARELDHECSDGTARRVDADTLLKLLAPFAPFVTEELWDRTGHEDSVHERGTWPVYDPELATPQRANIAITVDGKRRGEFEVDSGRPRPTSARWRSPIRAWWSSSADATRARSSPSSTAS